MNFFIRKGSTLNTLKVELINDGRHEYKSFYEKLQNSKICFTMKDVSTGEIKIANKPASVELKHNPSNPTDEEYYIVYEWEKRDTNKSGMFIGGLSLFKLYNHRLSWDLIEKLYKNNANKYGHNINNCGCF